VAVEEGVVEWVPEAKEGRSEPQVWHRFWQCLRGRAPAWRPSTRRSHGYPGAQRHHAVF